MKRRLIALAAWTLTAAAPAWAQFDAGTVLGTIHDTSGGVLPGVTVTLTNRDTGVTATRPSDDRGSFEFPTVRVGVYTVKAELAGFVPREVANITVDV
ncbi:MAG: carboxypeptidase-like regulatory domain-containing protein, partial [Acidobacteriaceae bacterium]|nr:carboxypeptidase-like regulatory domain-containing protein [Acidobacteriaceae bacterium]